MREIFDSEETAFTRNWARMPEEPRAPNLKHGCRSQQLLLADEDPNDLWRLRQMYLDEFQPQSAFLQKLVEDLVQARWYFERTQRQLYRVQANLPEDPCSWTPEQHHQLALFLRYQTAADYQFNRSMARLLGYQRHQQRTEKAKTSAQEAKSPKAPKKEVPVQPVVMEQWVEVRRIENQIVTEFYPPNDEFLQEIETSERKPTLIYRRFFFCDGVPSYYEWVRPRKGMAIGGGACIQRMTIETWLSLLDKESQTNHAEFPGQTCLRDWRDEES